MQTVEKWLASPIGQWAKIYVEYGFAIFPCHGVVDGKCTCGKSPCGENNKQAGKHPFTRHGVSDASTDLGKIGAMFNHRSDLNIAIATGTPSGVFVLDIDNRDGISGEDTLRDLQDEHGAMPQTLTSITGNGRQMFFKMPDFDVRNATGIAPKLDIRGTGGYVITAPSMHYSGKQYAFDESTFDAGIAEAPTWLLTMLRPKKKAARELSHDYASGALPEWSKEDVESMLAVLLPDMGYDDWLHVGMALHAGGYPLSMFDNWSRGGQKYQNGDCEIRWRGFGKQDGITMGTLVDMAKLNGWKPAPFERPVIDTSIVDALVKKLSPNAPPLPAPECKVAFDPLKLPGLIGDTVSWICSDAMFPQPMLALLNILAFAGAVFGRQYASPFNTRTNAYFVAVAETTGGKDHSRKKIGVLAEATGLNQYVGAHAIISDTGLARALHANPSQMLMVDEFGKFMQAIADKNAGAWNKKIIKLMMNLYSDSSGIYKHGDYANPKVNEAVVIHSPNLCIYGTTTEKEYIKALNKDAVESGELNRIIAIKVPSVDRNRVGGINPLPDDIKDRWERFAPDGASLGALLNSATVPPEPVIVEWGDCDDLQWQIALEQDKVRKTGTATSPLWGRRHENIIKVAMIFAIARNKSRPEFQEADFKVAVAILDSSISYMAGLVHNNLAENDHERAYIEILEYIRAAGAAGVAKSVLSQRFRKFKRRDTEELIGAMIEQDLIVADRIAATTKPVIIYRAL